MLRIIKIAVFILILFSLTVVLAAVQGFNLVSIQKKKQQQNIPVKNYTMVWNDEFSGKKLDTTKWVYYQLGKRRDAINTKENVIVDGAGYLRLRVHEKNNQIFAAIISTEGLYQTRYGYFECRARLTKAKGIWPAFWLNASTNGDYGTPEKNGAEIDIFEYFPNINPRAVTHNLHWGGYGVTHRELGFIYTQLKETMDSFHVFGLEWTDTSYTVFVDGVRSAHGNMNISKVPQNILLSVECDDNGGGPLERTMLPDEFIVDYVRVYKRNTTLHNGRK